MNTNIQTEIIDYIKEYFRFCDLNLTHDIFEKELKQKVIPITFSFKIIKFQNLNKQPSTIFLKKQSQKLKKNKY